MTEFIVNNTIGGGDTGSITVLFVPTLNNGFNGEATQLRIKSDGDNSFIQGDKFNLTLPIGVTWNNFYSIDGTVPNAIYHRVDDRTIQFTVTENTNEIMIPLQVRIDGAEQGELNVSINAPSNSSIPVGRATFADVREQPSTGGGGGNASPPLNPVAYKVFINGNEVISDSGYYEINGIIISPLRTVTEALGLRTSWDANTKQIKFRSDERTLVLTVGSTTYLLNGSQGTLPVPPMIKNDFTLVPMQFVVEAFGGSVQFVNNNSSIQITSVPNLSNGFDGEATQLRIKSGDGCPFVEGDLFHVTLPSGVTWNDFYLSEGTVPNANYRRLDDRQIQFTVTGNPIDIVIPLNVKIDGASNGAMDVRVEAPPSSSIPVGQATFAYISEVSNEKDILELVSDLKESGKNSNDFVEHSIINLDNLLNGTILITKYSGLDELKSEKTWIVNSQSKSEATDKITRFIFELTNRYRPETELVLSVSEDKTIIHTYTVGEKKERAMWAITDGLKEALQNAPITEHSDNTWVDKYNPEIDECFIATASYGSKFEPSVVILREFRDRFLMTNSLGQSFVRFYYKNSPPIARNIAENERKKSLVRFMLTPMVFIARIIVKKD